MRTALRFSFLVAFFVAPVVWSDETPSVLVTTAVARRGEVPDVVVAYGTAAPAIDRVMTLSVPAEGRVMRILTTPGESVHIGQTLIEFQLSATASSALAQATTALSVARTEQAHIERLLAQQLTTRDQKAQADKAVADAKTTLDALRRETGAREQNTLSAPFDGIVTAIPVAQGDRVAAGAALITVARNNGMRITVGVEPRDLPRLALGQPVTLASLADDASRHAGQVAKIDKSLNSKTRLVDVDVTIKDDVLNGEAFRADITVGHVTGWLVPRNAVLDDDDGTSVFQVAAGKAVRVEVKRIGSIDETIAVDGPIDPSRRIVVKGNYQLADGVLVRERAASAPQSDAPGAKSKGSK
jgi:membrane fusion protein (multidrug efflux system)